MRNCFVIRVTTDEFTFADIRDELIVNGVCREGWGPEGADLRKGVDFFIDALKQAWGDVKDAARRYSNLVLMTKIKVGDLIIIPKVSLSEPGIGQYFTVAECTAEYSFAPLSKYDDFGHTVGVKVLNTWSYRSENISANIIGKLLMGISMSKPINRIRNPETIQAVENLIGNAPTTEEVFIPAKEKAVAPQENHMTDFFKAVNNLPLSDPTRKNYLMLEILRMLSNNALKKVIKELFTENGCRLIEEEPDFVFELAEKDTMLYVLTEQKKIFVHVNSSPKLDAPDGNIHIVIDLTGTLEKSEGIIFIDGETFINLLARHKV